MGSGGRVWKADSNVPVFLFLFLFSRRPSWASCFLAWDRSAAQTPATSQCDLRQPGNTQENTKKLYAVPTLPCTHQKLHLGCASTVTNSLLFLLREYLKAVFRRRDEQTARCMWTDDLHQPKLFRGEKWKWEYWRKWLAELNWVLSLKIRLVTSSQSPKWRLQKSCFVWSTV